MATSPYFNEELQKVNSSKAFTYVIGASGHTENQFSVSGWTVYGGTDAACEHGASEALYRMGFRFYDPVTTIRPASVPTNGINLAKQEYSFTNVRIFYNYGAKHLTDEDVRWGTLNCIRDLRWPNGHAWGSIKNRINAVDNWFNDHPNTWLMPPNPLVSANGGFNLSLTGAERQAMVDRIAKDIAENLNRYDRHHFDPQDGDRYSTDEIIKFSNEVVAKVRETKPNAMLGIYAYANHREPPTIDCPHIYVQIALGFNDLGIGYAEMVRRWKQKAGGVALRGYGDIAAWRGWMPASGGIEKRGYANPYKEYISDGAKSLNLETSANFCKGGMGLYYFMRTIKTGDVTFDGVLQEYVNHLYNGDPVAKEFFEYLASPGVGINDFTFVNAFEILDRMQPSARKTTLEQYMTLMWNHWTLGPKRNTSGLFSSSWTDKEKTEYWIKLENCLRWAWYLGRVGQFHGYAYVRQMANSNTNRNGRSDLSFDSGPDWQRNPRPPSKTEYLNAKQEAATIAYRPSQLNFKEDLSDLVVVDVKPEGGAASLLREAHDFNIVGVGKFIVVGPSLVKATYSNIYKSKSGTGVDEYQFGPGLHEITFASTAVSWEGGHVFLQGFPTVRLDPSKSPNGAAPRWGYLPKLSQGKLKLSAGSRISLYHAGSTSRVDIIGSAPQNIAPGVVRIDGINTRGTGSWITTNPFISGTPYKMLMPRALAEFEFPGSVFIDVKEP